MSTFKVGFKAPCGVFVLFFSFAYHAYGQSCTSNPTTLSSNINFASISWTGAGGVTAAQCTAIANGSNTTTTANFFVDLANGKVLTISNNVKINGTFDITGGNASQLSVNGGGSNTTLTVTGNLGDATNNGVIYNVQASTDHIVVGGTLYGKNNNALQGNGSISGNAINVKNGTTCGSPCPATGGFSTCTSGDSFCSNYSVLPVDLLFFDGVALNDQVKLEWATASELNFDYFLVEKSVNGKDFFTLAQVKGHGTTNIRHDYQAADDQPQIGYNYYRLTSVDFDRYQETFDVVAVKYTGEKKMALFPNPFNGKEMNLNLNFPLTDSGSLSIFDITGTPVTHLSVTGSQSLIEFAEPLKPGIYIAKFSSPHFSDVTRLLVNP